MEDSLIMKAINRLEIKLDRLYSDNQQASSTTASTTTTTSRTTTTTEETKMSTIPIERTTDVRFLDDDVFENEFFAPVNSTIALQPQSIIAYCSIVEPTIFGGEYSNILRIVSIPKERSDYVIQEFKNKNFLQLLNTEISEIEINFRTHGKEKSKKQTCSSSTT